MRNDTQCIGGECALKYDCVRWDNYNNNTLTVQWVYIAPPFKMLEDMCTCDCYLQLPTEEIEDEQERLT